MSGNFYQKLKPFTDFSEFAQASHHVRPPEDWFLVISDVQGSTKAIEQGKYKIVNMVGASTIAALANTLGTMDFPFVFGGDGATALIPADFAERAKQALRAVRRNAMESFGMNLRLGMVPISDLHAAGTVLEVSKFALGGGPSIAFFRGRGMTEAEAWVKSGRYQIEDGAEAALDKALQGLSCRWAPLQNVNGCMLAVIIKAKADKDATVLSSVLSQIEGIVDLDSGSAHPVKPEIMKAENLLLASKIESKVLRLRPLYLARVVIIAQMLVVRILRKFDLGIQGIKFRQYLRDNVTHSDYRKFDEMLRLVFDCSQEVKAKVLTVLEKARLEGKIYYGVAESNSALLTCFVQNLGKGKHVHFVDGNHGGYALAAQQMKRQMKEGEVLYLSGPRTYRIKKS